MFNCADHQKEGCVQAVHAAHTLRPSWHPPPTRALMLQSHLAASWGPRWHGQRTARRRYTTEVSPLQNVNLHRSLGFVQAALPAVLDALALPAWKLHGSAWVMLLKHVRVSAVREAATLLRTFSGSATMEFRVSLVAVAPVRGKRLCDCARPLSEWLTQTPYSA